MASINSKKLLPSTEKKTKVFLVPYTNIIPSTPKLDGITPTEEKKVSVKNSLADEKFSEIIKFFRYNLLLKERDKKRKKREDERKRFEENESKLEEKKAGKKSQQDKLAIKMPGSTIFDRLNKFVGFTLLGFIFNNFSNLLPGLTNIVEFLKPAAIGIGNFIGSLFSGTVEWIHGGYEAYDNISEIVKNLGGENFARLFNEFSKTLNFVINGALLAGAAILRGGNLRQYGRSSGSNIGGGRNSSSSGSNRSRAGRRGVSRVDGIGGINYRKGRIKGETFASGSKLADARIDRLEKAGRLTFDGKSATDMAYQQRKGETDIIKKYTDRFGRKKAIERFGSETVNGLGGKYARSAGTNVARKFTVGILGKGGTKVASKAVSRISGKIPIVGPLIDFAIRTLVLKEPVGKAAAAAVGMAAGQALGSFLGGSIGGIVGSVVPIVGNLLLGSAGVMIGGLIGGIVGDMLGTSLYDIVANMSGNKKKEGFNQGGVVASRQISTNKKIKKGKSITISPVGLRPTIGEEGLRNLYGNSVELLKKISGVMSNPGKFIGSLMSSSINLLFGQNFDEGLLSYIGENFGKDVESNVRTTTGSVIRDLRFYKSDLSPQNTTPQNTTPQNTTHPTVIQNNNSQVIQTSPYGMRNHPIDKVPRMHTGIDLAPPGPGYFVSLKVPGKVTRVSVDPGGFGNFIIITSSQTGMSYMFAHMATISFKNGDSYAAGQSIGEIGSTGKSTAIHLHYEVYKGGKDGRAVDPAPYRNLLTISKTISQTQKSEGKVSVTQVTPSQIAKNNLQTNNIIRSNTKSNTIASLQTSPSYDGNNMIVYAIQPVMLNS